MVRLYDYLPSGNGYKVRLLLTQLDIPFERIELDIIKGETRAPAFIGKFPNTLLTDHGRAVNQAEPGWEKTLTGLPKELYGFWEQHLRSRGYKLRCQIVDFPGGMPGDVGITLSWS